MKMKRIIPLVVMLIVLTVVLAGCIPGDARYTLDSPAGFWWGIWHGLVAWISFFIGLFTSGEFTIYETTNTGWPYNLGFLIGVGSSIGGCSGGLVRINLFSRRKSSGDCCD